MVVWCDWPSLSSMERVTRPSTPGTAWVFTGVFELGVFVWDIMDLVVVVETSGLSRLDSKMRLCSSCSDDDDDEVEVDAEVGVDWDKEDDVCFQSVSPVRRDTPAKSPPTVATTITSSGSSDE